MGLPPKTLQQYLLQVVLCLQAPTRNKMHTHLRACVFCSVRCQHETVLQSWDCQKLYAHFAKLCVHFCVHLNFEATPKTLNGFSIVSPTCHGHVADSNILRMFVVCLSQVQYLNGALDGSLNCLPLMRFLPVRAVRSVSRLTVFTRLGARIERLG